MQHAAKILIVDDNPNIHEILRNLFSSCGEAGDNLTLHADNGQAALGMLVKNPDIDVIILDLDMPVMNGFETLTRIRSDLRFRSIPVCVFSGSKDDSIKALKLGARDFINKPGNYHEIKIRVLNLVENKRRGEASERAKINFISNVNHEFRTPMNGVIGCTQLMQMTELTAEQSTYIKLIEQSAQSMMTLITGVFSFIESETPLYDQPKKSFSLELTVQECIKNLAANAEKNCVTLTVYIHPDIPDHLSGYPDKIELIFQHLLSNAIKFSPYGKVFVIINLGRRDTKSVELICTVTDNGIGISPEVQHLVFEPFCQADESNTREFGGLGIGLSIANCIVQMMGSALKIESCPGGGSKFSFAITCALNQQ